MENRWKIVIRDNNNIANVRIYAPRFQRNGCSVQAVWKNIVYVLGFFLYRLNVVRTKFLARLFRL